MTPKQKQILLIALLVILVGVSLYYYSAVYLPALAQAGVIERTIEAQR